MFPLRYFTKRYWTGRFWSPSSTVATTTPEVEDTSEPIGGWVPIPSRPLLPTVIQPPRSITCIGWVDTKVSTFHGTATVTRYDDEDEALELLGIPTEASLESCYL